MKRIIVWIDCADKDAAQVRERLKEYLAKTSGLRVTIFETCEVMESKTDE